MVPTWRLVPAALIAPAVAAASALSSCSGAGHTAEVAPTLSFAAIADCQYADAADAGARRYRESGRKLRECVADLADEELSFAVHLGDFIDRDFTSFDVVEPVFRSLPFPTYHVLGNHDFEVEDGRRLEVPARLGMPGRFHHFGAGGWRFVVLDGNDLSLHGWPEGSSAWRAASAYRAERAPDAPEWNGAIGPGQLAWLAEVLDEAEAAGEQVILFCHYPTLPGDLHSLWNAEEVLEVVEARSNVRAWIHGHDHAGGFELREGVAHLNLKGMVNTAETAYAVIHLGPETIRVDGRGREEDREWPQTGSDID